MDNKAVFTQVACMFMCSAPRPAPRRARCRGAATCRPRRGTYRPDGLRRERLQQLSRSFTSPTSWWAWTRRAETSFSGGRGAALNALAFEEGDDHDNGHMPFRTIPTLNSSRTRRTATQHQLGAQAFQGAPDPGSPTLRPKSAELPRRHGARMRCTIVYDGSTRTPRASTVAMAAMPRRARASRIRAAPGRMTCSVELTRVCGIHGEMVELAAVPVGTAWSPAHEFECRDPRHDDDAGAVAPRPRPAEARWTRRRRTRRIPTGRHRPAVGGRCTGRSSAVASTKTPWTAIAARSLSAAYAGTRWVYPRSWPRTAPCSPMRMPRARCRRAVLRPDQGAPRWARNVSDGGRCVRGGDA